MNTNVANILRNIKSPSIYEILDMHGRNLKYNPYSMNAHSTGKINVNELGQFVKLIDDDYNDLHGKSHKNVDNYYSSLLHGQCPTIELQQGGDIRAGFDFIHVYANENRGLSREQTEARLYLNLKAENIIGFSEIFYEKCKENNLPGYFKFASEDNERNDTWLVYSSYENLDKYIDIIKDIKKSHSNLLDGAENISPNMGIIDGFIGYGEEPWANKNGNPEKLSHNEKMSYNERLGKVSNEIFKNVHRELMKDRGHDYAKFEYHSDANDSLNFQSKEPFGATGKSLEDFIDSFITSYSELQIKTYLHIHGQESMNKDKQKYVLDRAKAEFKKQLENVLLNHGEFQDYISINGLVFPFSKVDWFKYIKDHAFANDNKVNNREEVHDKLLNAMFYPGSKISNQDIQLFETVKEEFLRSLQEELINNPTNLEINAINDKFLSMNDRQRKIMIKSISTSLVSSFDVGSELLNPNISFKMHIDGKEVDMAKYINKFNVLEKLVGKDRVNNIINQTCANMNVDKDNVCFNETTKKLIKNAQPAKSSGQTTMKTEKFEHDYSGTSRPPHMQAEEIKYASVSQPETKSNNVTQERPSLIDVSARDKREDYRRYMSVKIMREITDTMRRKSVKLDNNMSHDINNIDNGTFDAINDTFDIMFTDDKRSLMYDGKRTSISEIAEDIFFNDKREELDTLLADTNLHLNARKVLEKLKVTTRMYQAYLDISNVVDHGIDRGDYMMDHHIQGLKDETSYYRYQNAEQYFSLLKGGMGHDESFWALMKNSFCEDKNLSKIHDGYLINQFNALEFADNMQRQLSRSQEDLGIR